MVARHQFVLVVVALACHGVVLGKRVNQEDDSRVMKVAVFQVEQKKAESESLHKEQRGAAARSTCCGQLETILKARPGQGKFIPFVKFKKVRAGKSCAKIHSLHPFVEAAEGCCDGLNDGESQSLTDSPCLRNGIICSEFGAVKASDNAACLCRDGELMQTKVKGKGEGADLPEFYEINHERYVNFEQGRFSVFEQGIYGLMCMEDADVTCKAVHARRLTHKTQGALSVFKKLRAQGGNADHCLCKESQVCFGSPCKLVGGKYVFPRKHAFITGLMHNEFQLKMLKKLSIDYEVGCTSKIDCATFGAISKSKATCVCPEIEGKSGTLRQSVFLRAPPNHEFHPQEAWDNNYECRVNYVPQCPGFSQRYEEEVPEGYDFWEPFCECIEPRVCSGPNCSHLRLSNPRGAKGHLWIFPELQKADHECF